MLQYLLSFKKYSVRHDILNLCIMNKINKMSEINNDINKLNEINKIIDNQNKIIEINKINDINNNSIYLNKTTSSQKLTIKILFEKFYNMILEEDEILNAVIN